jgi:CheY-like chemotaxis protein/HPt (histidine-containing phosphotransfer) domain-containing protein
VLLAEDHAVNREVALELLHGAGLAVDTAADGERAVAMARASAYDLILMDVQMPAMDGLAATRAIRAIPGREHVPILAMTANAFEEDRRACEAAGMDDFVPKPVDPEALYAALSHWLAIGAAQGRLPPDREDGKGLSQPPTGTLARLQALPGLDVARGLAAVRGDAARYLDLLGRVATSGARDARRLREHLAAGETQAARDVAHNLKGVAATMGAMRLADLAGRLEAHLRRGEAAHPALLDDIAGELALLSAALPPPLAALPASPPAADAMPVAGILDALEALLAQSDARALDVLAEREPILRAAFGEPLDELVRSVHEFEFDTALHVLRRLRP